MSERFPYNSDRGRSRYNGKRYSEEQIIGILKAHETGAKLRFIQPGKPTQNEFVESFNGKFRDSCLNQRWFLDLDDARHLIEGWCKHYNAERPHSSLGYVPPAVFESQVA
jgi:putative transposase